ncbi:MAG: hypothetical protein JRJ85_20435, partial [Deltaproteobacteria bacterium]|nr:hypothetical protein [Deltaproteobacteria bacterium]
DGELKINSGTLYINGNNIITCTNFLSSGTLKLNGNESVSFNNWTSSGTWQYVGQDGPYTIQEFGGSDYYDFEIVDTTAVFNATAALNIAHDCTISSGTMDLAGFQTTVSGAFTNNSVLQLDGDETITGTPVNTTGSLVRYDGASGPYSVFDWTYENIEFDGSGELFNLQNNLVVNSTFTITAGTVSTTAGDYAIDVACDWCLVTGDFECNESTVTFTGAIEHQLTGATTFYGFKCLATGATLQFTAGTTTYAKHMIDFEGIYLRSSSEGTTWYFKYNGSSQTVKNCTISDSNADNGSQIIAYDNCVDDGNNHNWLFVVPDTLTWDGSESTDWNTAANWDYNQVPSADAIVIIPDVTNDPVLASDVTIASITIQSGAELSVNKRSITVSSDVYVYGTLTCSSTDHITVGGSWFTDSGAVFTAASSTVTFNASASGHGILLNGTSFYNLAFNGTGGWTISDAMDVSNDFTLTDGSVTQTGSLAVGNDFSLAGGTFTCAAPQTYSFSVGGSFSISDGTFDRYTGDPYLIRDVYDLQAMNCDLTADYKLNDNIDASETETNSWNSGAGFEPIGHGAGSGYTEFTGSLDGSTMAIIGLYINRTGDTYIGLFAWLGSGAEVTNLGFAGGSVSGTGSVGGVVGYNSGAISNSYNTGSVSGSNDYAGGVAGRNDGAISNSYNTGYVSGDDGVGGVAGWNSDTISNFYNTGSVSGSNKVGGVVGYNYDGSTISNSYNTGYVSGSIEVGGVAGRNQGVTISNSYNTGSVSGSSKVGGVVGINICIISNSYNTGSISGSSDYAGGVAGKNYGTISNSYNTGYVSGSSDIGGVTGYNDDTVSNSFYDSQTSSQSDTGKGAPKTTAEMMTESTFIERHILTCSGNILPARTA